ncbi:unnamed protein product, partial [Phaeothamnion confervicola]
QVHHTPTAGRLKAVEACEPRDVYWNNTYVTKRTRLLRRLFVDAFLALLYVFYIVPVTLIYLRFRSIKRAVMLPPCLCRKRLQRPHCRCWTMKA